METLDGPLTGRAVHRHRLALLALLACARLRRMSRDKLIAYLWPETDAERGRHLLSDSVYRINGAVGGEAIVSLADGLRLADCLHSDLISFEKAVADGEDEEAVGLYAGPFLDGFFIPEAPEFERWAEAQRHRLARTCSDALERLAERMEQWGDLRTAISWWRRLAQHEPDSSRVALRLMKALVRGGDPAAAIRHAYLHNRHLEQELGAPPDAGVTEFAHQLLTAPRRPQAN